MRDESKNEGGMRDERHLNSGMRDENRTAGPGWEMGWEIGRVWAGS